MGCRPQGWLDFAFGDDVVGAVGQCGRLCIAVEPALVQFGGFGFGGDEDGELMVGVFPESKENLVCVFRFG